MRRDFADVDGPERAANGEDVLWVADLLVAEELRPGAVRVSQKCSPRMRCSMVYSLIRLMTTTGRV